MNRPLPRPSSLRRRAFASLAAAVAWVALLSGLLTHSAAGFTIAQVPPFLPTPPAPNIILTLPTSTDSAWGYAPDPVINVMGARRYASATVNEMYYNPAVIYTAPPDASGTALTTSFSAARINGYAAGRGTVNLSTSYRPTAVYQSSIEVGNFPPDGKCNWLPDDGVPSLLPWIRFAQHPAQEYGNLAADRCKGVAAYYYIYSPALSACAPVSTDNDNCYVRRIVGDQAGPADLNRDGRIDGDDERQNFANWYSFYRTRLFASVAAVAFALANPALANARIAFQDGLCNQSFTSTEAASCTGWGGTTGVDRRIRVFDSTHRQRAYQWLFGVSAGGSGDPISYVATAGEYFRTSVANDGSNTPWANNPQATNPGGELSCRQNFHVVVGGIPNVNTGPDCTPSPGRPTVCGNYDGIQRTLPDGKVYSATAAENAIYRDNWPYRLSDSAFFYWATDLRPDLTNNVLPYYAERRNVTAGTTTVTPYWNPKNDPATWQHMTNYFVGFGVRQQLQDTGLAWDQNTWGPAGGYPALLAGTKTWPSTDQPYNPVGDPGNMVYLSAYVYDLWHAAIASRGQLFNADKPIDLVGALSEALDRVLEQNSGAASATVNSSRGYSTSVTTPLLFQALLYSGDWTGEMRAFRLKADGSPGDLYWSTSEANKIPAWGARQNQTFTWGGSGAIAFTETALTSAGLWDLVKLEPRDATSTSVAVAADDVLRYVLGDTSKEQRVANGIYRTRSGPPDRPSVVPIGDIINSDPVHVHQERYQFYALPEGAATATKPYLNYVASKADRKPMLYVGSNGGMLHAFEAQTGKEVFTYVPGAVLGNLPALLQPTYAHRYYVDGSPTAWDAYFTGTQAGWRTVVLGTTGAGGKAVFAIDVTDPTALNAGKVLWEINSSTPDTWKVSGAVDPNYAADLGFTLGQAAVGRMYDGTWVAVFGNGYRSTNNRAVLYIVRLSDGYLLRKFDTGVGSSTSPNGLGTPTLVDSDNNQIIDYIYAGDQLGNVWKFDVRSTTPSTWAIALSGSPLFTAKSGTNTVQPISVRLRAYSAGPNPNSPLNGRNLMFGTGRLWAVDDNTDTSAQTFYSVWDNDVDAITGGRSWLQAQTVTTSNFDAAAWGAPSYLTQSRTVSQNAVSWSARNRGWYIDLPASGERVIGEATIINARSNSLSGAISQVTDTLLITSVVPSSDPCSFGGRTWLMQVAATTGSSVLKTQTNTYGREAVFDLYNAALATGPKPTTEPDGIFMQGIIRRVAVVEGQLIGSGTQGTEVQTLRSVVLNVNRERTSWRRVSR